MEPKIDPATGLPVVTPNASDAAASALIAKAVGEAMAPLRKEFADALASLKTRGPTNHMDGLPTQKDGPTVTGGSQVKAPAGIGAARIMKAGMLAKMKGLTPDRVLKAWGYEAEARSFLDAQEKAMGQNVLSEGGALVPIEYSTEIINLLRNTVAVRVLGARTLPMGASIEIPEQTNSASAFYVGENLPVTPSEPKTGGMRLTEKKLMGLVPVSNDLIRNASLDAEAFVRDDLVQVLRLREDFQAIFGAGGEHSPRGIVSLVDTGHLYDAVAVAPKAPTLAEVKLELAKAKGRLKTANIPMVKLGWIMSPRTEQWLYAVTDGNGNSVFQASLDAGMLHGFPVVVTNQIPENLDGTTDASRLIFGDFTQFIIGESMGMEVEMFPNATYDSTGGGSIVSGISSDQSVIRAIAKHDFGMRYRKAFVVVRLRWGAP
jgi:HK97 family phage major capsid protein